MEMTKEKLKKKLKQLFVKKKLKKNEIKTF